jgi:hypothetical protein
MAIPLETAEIQIDTVGVDAALSALHALTNGEGSLDILTEADRREKQQGDDELEDLKALDPKASAVRDTGIHAPLPPQVDDEPAYQADLAEGRQGDDELEDLKALDPKASDESAYRADLAEGQQGRDELEDLEALDAVEPTDDAESRQAHEELPQLQALEAMLRAIEAQNELLERIAAAVERPHPQPPTPTY